MGNSIYRCNVSPADHCRRRSHTEQSLKTSCNKDALKKVSPAAFGMAMVSVPMTTTPPSEKQKSIQLITPTISSTVSMLNINHIRRMRTKDIVDVEIIASTSEMKKSIRNKKLVSEFEGPATAADKNGVFEEIETKHRNKPFMAAFSRAINIHRIVPSMANVSQNTKSIEPHPPPLHLVDSSGHEMHRSSVRSVESTKLETEFTFYMKDVVLEDITIADYMNMRKSWGCVLNDSLYMFHMLKKDGLIESSDCLAWVYDTFYKHLYEYDPTLKDIFHNNLKIQSKALVNIVQRSIQIARDMTRAMAAATNPSDSTVAAANVNFRDLYVLHKNLGITIRHYFIIIHILLVTFRDCMANMYSDTVEESWNKVMSYYLNQIILEYKKDASSTVARRSFAAIVTSAAIGAVSSKSSAPGPAPALSTRMAAIVAAPAASSKGV